jgi:hypothetical protein
LRVSCSITDVKAQDIGQRLVLLVDANKYLNAYLEPLGKEGEILNMGRGWFNSAKVHKRLGFDKQAATTCHCSGRQTKFSSEMPIILLQIKIAVQFQPPSCTFFVGDKLPSK